MGKPGQNLESLRLLEPKIAKIVLLTYRLRKISKNLAQLPSYSFMDKHGQKLESLRLLEPKIAKIVLLTYRLRKFQKIWPNYLAILLWIKLVKIWSLYDL